MPELYAAVPQVPISGQELVGAWEHIDLSYNYGKMQASTVLTLESDHTVSNGVWKGKSWSYNKEDAILTIDGIDLYLARECDWEASPRTHTIVFAGLGNRKVLKKKKGLHETCHLQFLILDLFSVLYVCNNFTC